MSASKHWQITVGELTSSTTTILSYGTTTVKLHNSTHCNIVGIVRVPALILGSGLGSSDHTSATRFGGAEKAGTFNS